ncbi:MAG: DUF58 domain-containing protein [Bacillota bacterium]
MIVLQGKLYKKYIFSGVKVERSFEQQGVFPGETVAYKVSVTNMKLLPLTWLNIDEAVPIQLEFLDDDRVDKLDDASNNHQLIYSVLPYQRVNRRYQVKCHKRGYYELRDITMTSTNLLGSENYEQSREVFTPLAVYPNLREVGDDFIPANTMLGDFSVNRWIMDDPMMIVGIREYQSSDSFKSINWKLTAKNQKLLVNKYDYTADKKIMMLVNLDKSEYSMEVQEVELMEAALEVGASIAVKLIESGIPTGLATNAICIGEKASGLVEPDTGEDHIGNILTVFSQISYMKKLQSRELLKLLIKDFSWGTEIIVITLTPTDSLMEDLEELGDIKTTVLAFKQADIKHIPRNVSLYFYDRGGEKYEAV